MFATDKDLLLLEPTLFRDVAWTGQRLVTGLVQIASGVLKFQSSDVRITDAGVGPGCIAVVGLTPYEIVEVINDTDATISKVRAGSDDPLIPMADIETDVPAIIATFAPQTAIVHRQVLRMLGIEPEHAAPGAPTPSDITNPRALARLEALGALHLIYSAAGALSPADSPANQRAELYRRRFSEERSRCRVEIDTNGDGLPDATRTLNVIQFVRA
jgi:hypothetical protein